MADDVFLHRSKIVMADNGFQVSAVAMTTSGASVAAAIRPAIQTNSSSGDRAGTNIMAEPCRDSQNQEMILFNDLAARDHLQCQFTKLDNCSIDVSKGHE